ncbi:MAG: Clp protease N-terminal domain-containing protein [Acidimicrobiia bacterium]|nr:Clp protease N-terminal domain-containing protein [Acidimicrobiia bacterium]
MNDDALDLGDLDAFGADARLAVAAADALAREIGHDRVGTEHLLLGLLAVEPCDAASLLADAGATLAAARHQVIEAVGPVEHLPPQGRALPRTARASRAIGRAVRFSHHRHAPDVGTEHLLLGVLDVEGTAGQVLRKLGLDLDALRLAIDAERPGPPDGEVDDPATLNAADPTATPAPALPPMRCPSCRSAIDDHLTWRSVVASPHDPTDAVRTVLIVACGECGTAIGAHLAG